MSDRRTVEEALAQITAIIDRLDSMGAGDPRRSQLIARRDELRREARDASAASRSEDTLRYELEQARRGLAEIDARTVERSDAASGANRINELLREQDAAARETIERRIAEIENQLGGADQPARR